MLDRFNLFLISMFVTFLTVQTSFGVCLASANQHSANEIILEDVKFVNLEGNEKFRREQNSTSPVRKATFVTMTTLAGSFIGVLVGGNIGVQCIPVRRGGFISRIISGLLDLAFYPMFGAAVGGTVGGAIGAFGGVVIDSYSFGNS